MYKQINSFDRYNQFFAIQIDVLLSLKKNADANIKKKVEGSVEIPEEWY